MESATFSETRGSYSRCWDGHITPKNSKWLQENLTDMDSKIKSMIKLIEEDADSFARRAEMYYMKRPELMKLVKEFYRAYRALAERYDRVTGALRQAHRDIAVAFPNQIQSVLPDEPPSELPYSVEAVREVSFMLSYADGSDKYVPENNPFMSCEECKHLNCLLADEEGRKRFTEGLIIRGLLLKQDAGENFELKKLKEELSDLSKENENLKNQIASESLQADKAENESQNFKSVISKLKFQLEATFLQYKVSQERMACLEAEISQSQEEASHLNDEMSVTVINLNIAEARCFDLEKENGSLQFEISKCNETLSRKLEETIDLSKENQNLHNTIKLESMRAQQAEAEACRLTDAIAKLKADLGSSLLQYKVSQERISELEGEICRFGDQFQNLNVEMSIRSCKLNMAEEQYLVAQEENKSLQSTVDKFKILMAKQEEGVALREEELCKLKKFIEDEHHNKSCAGIQEKMSLELELSELKQRFTGKEEETAAKEKELDKLKQSSEKERQWRMSADSANQTMKKLYSQSEEKIRLMGLEIQSGTELLRRMELSKSGLEEENKRLYDENNDLKQTSFSSASKIVDLQDEINFLRRSKLKITDELSFHLDENKDLQQELSSLKNERQNFEERHNELMEQLVEVNLNAVSLRALVQELLDGKTGLKYAYKQFEDEKLSNLKYLKLMECFPEKNSFLENSLSELTTELRWLREKIKGLEECCKSLHGNTARHSSENAVLVSHAEAVTNNIKKLSEKSTLIENSLSDVIFDFEGLRKEVKALEESCKPLYHENCFLVTEKSNLVSQVEKIEQHMESLENRFSAFEGKHVTMGNGKDLALYLVEEAKDLLKSTKEDKENHAFFFKNKRCALNNQIHILKERNQIINDVLEEELHKSMKSDIDCFVMLQVLHDIFEKNMILSDECQKNVYKLRRAEKLTVELKHDLLTQEKKLALLLEHDEKLAEWIQVMSREFVAKEGSGSVNAGNMEFKSNNTIKFSGYNLLEQLGLSLAELRAHKSDLEQDSETKMREISFLHRKIDELMGINEQLRANLNASNQQKDKLKIELDKMRQKVADLLELQHSFQGKVQTKLFDESECISSTSFDLGEQADYQEEEHESSLEEVIQEHLPSKLRSSDTENSLEIDQLLNDVQNLHGIANNLGLDIKVINKNMKTLQTENKHLKDLVVNFVTRNSVLFEDNIILASEMLEQPMMKLQLKNKNLCTSLEYLMVDLNKANVMREDLEKKILFLSDENFHKEDENKILRQSNENLVVEISRFDKEAEALRKREMNLRTELQRVKDKSRGFEEEIESHILDINAATINEFMFKQKFVELMLKFKSLEARNFLQYEIYSGKVSARNVLGEDLIKRVNILEKENKGLKEELTSYLPLARSLDIDIASLEEQTLSLANELILNSKRKQGNNLLAPLQRKRFCQSRGKDHVPNVSAGIMELKKMHAKVKQLLKAVTYTERLLTQGGVAFDANLVSKMKRIKPRRSKGVVRQLETEKKDFSLDVRESKAADRDVKLLKINQELTKVKHEQITKDIGLDHVLGSLRAGVDIKTEIDGQKAGETLNPTLSNANEPHNIDITEVERSEIPSSEIVLEKALSVDKLELPMTNDNQSSQVWSKRISETLSSDSLRLSIMLENLEELKKDIQVSEMSGQSSNSAFNDISDQLQISESVIKELIDINVKLTKMAGNFSSSLDDSKGRCQVLKRVRRTSDKIDEVELELENMQCILSKLLEEQQSQAQKASQRKSRFPLKDFIYGKRNDAKPMKRRFCSCIRFNAKGD